MQITDNSSGFNTISTKGNGSSDSIIKSQFNSSVDEYEPSDLYEVHNVNDPIHIENDYDLAYKNKGKFNLQKYENNLNSLRTYWL